MTQPPRIQTAETWDGYAYVNGRVHGSKWRKVWEVVVRFDSEEEARAFMGRQATPTQEVTACPPARKESRND